MLRIRGQALIRVPVQPYHHVARSHVHEYETGDLSLLLGKGDRMSTHWAKYACAFRHFPVVVLPKHCA